MHHLLGLHQQHLSILPCDQCRLQPGFLRVRLAVEDVHRQLQQLVAMCGIDVGSRQYGVAHQLDAPTLAGQSVDAAVADKPVLAHLLPFRQRLAGAHRHAVVLCEDKVDAAQVAFVALHLLIGTLFGPVAVQHGCKTDVGVALHGVGKTIVPLDGRRRTLQTLHLHHHAAATEL